MVIFGVDMSSSLKFDKNGKDIFIFGESPGQVLGCIQLILLKKIQCFI